MYLGVASSSLLSQTPTATIHNTDDRTSTGYDTLQGNESKPKSQEPNLSRDIQTEPEVIDTNNMKYQSPALLLAFMLAPRHAISTTEWETDLIETWRTIGDCSPSTNMCDKCGLGVAVVDLNDGFETRTYNVGPGNATAPWGPDDH
jgi:hypothetical protein